MDPLLVQVAEEYHIDASIVENVLQVEKDHVYQKKSSYSRPHQTDYC